MNYIKKQLKCPSIRDNKKTPPSLGRSITWLTAIICVQLFVTFHRYLNAVYIKRVGLGLYKNKKPWYFFVSRLVILYGWICETCKERSDGIGIEVVCAKLITTYNPVTHTVSPCPLNVRVCRSAEQTCLRTPRSVSGVFRQSVLELCEIGNKKGPTLLC